MGKIVVQGTTFNIAGEKPTIQEEEVIQNYFNDSQKQSDLTSGKDNTEFNIESLLEQGGKLEDKETDSYLSSPEFGRLVTEVLLSIGGSVAAAYVPGGQVALPLMLARVGKYARPLITAAKTAIGAGVGGGTGAAISQTFDPKEDIVKEITRAAGEGAIGDVAGRGISKVLGGIYSKVVGKSTSTINEARVAEKLLSKEKKSIEEAIKAKSSGQTLDDFTEKRLARLQDELGPDYAQRISQAVITPSLVNKNFLLNVLENVTEGSFTGGGRIIRAREATLGALRSGLDDLIERATVVGKTQIPNEDVMGALFKEAVTEQDTLFRAASKAKYQEVDTILKNTIGDANVIDTRPLKALAKTQIKKLMKQGTLKNDEAIKTYQRAFNLGNKVSYGDMHEFNKTINALARNIDDSVPFRSKEAKILMKDAVDELTLGKTMGNKSAFKKIFGENYTFPVNNSLKKIPTELRDQIINANTFYKTGMKNFNDELVLKLMDKDPEKVYQFIVANGKNRTLVDNLFKRVDSIYKQSGNPAKAEYVKDLVRAQYYNDMLKVAKSGDLQTGVVDATKMKGFLRKTEETRNVLFGKDAKKVSDRLEAYKDAIAVGQGKFESGGLPGKMFVQLKQAAAVGQIPAALTAGYFSDPGSAVTILLAPAVLGRMFTNPTIANLLIKGAKPNNFATSSKVFGQILSKLSQSGDIDKEEAEMYKNQFSDFKTPPEKRKTSSEDELTDASLVNMGSSPVTPAPVQSQQLAQSRVATPTSTPSPVNTQVTDPMQFASLFPQDALGQAIAQRKVI